MPRRKITPTTPQLQNFSQYLHTHAISRKRLSRALGTSVSIISQAILRGSVSPGLRLDVETVLRESGYPVPENLWVNTHGHESGIVAGTRTLRRLDDDTVIHASPQPHAQPRRTQTRHLSTEALLNIHNKADPTIPNENSAPSYPTHRPKKDRKALPPMRLTLTARRRFQFNHDPFACELQTTDDVLETREHKEAVEEMLRAARHADFIAIIGEVGCGKTTCLEIFQSRLPRNVHLVKCHFPDKREINGSNLLDAIILDIAGELDQRTTIPAARERKARKVITLLEALEKQERTACLIIDEAHALNRECLRALKRLHELDRGFKRLLGIILLAQREILPKLNDPTLREVGQRCAQYEFRGLGKAATEYLRHKITRAGGNLETILPAESLREILKLCTRKEGNRTFGPYPLQLNALITQALNLADELDEPTISLQVLDAIRGFQGAY